MQRAIAAARDRDPIEVAKDRRVPHARLVATQVKYLARPPRSPRMPRRGASCLAGLRAGVERGLRRPQTDRGSDTVLDLTCGLGVDAFFLSRRFGRVVTLERNDVLARVAAENFFAAGRDEYRGGEHLRRGISGATACISTGSTPTPTAARPRAASWCGWRIVRPTSSP